MSNWCIDALGHWIASGAFNSQFKWKTSRIRGNIVSINNIPRRGAYHWIHKKSKSHWAWTEILHFSLFQIKIDFQFNSEYLLKDFDYHFLNCNISKWKKRKNNNDKVFSGIVTWEMHLFCCMWISLWFRCAETRDTF